jgi:hypothetical protein
VALLTLHKALIISTMTYACPVWEFAAVSHLLKFQRLRNKVLTTTGTSRRHTPTRDTHVAFIIPNLYDFYYKTVQAVSSSCRKS